MKVGIDTCDEVECSTSIYYQSPSPPPPPPPDVFIQSVGICEARGAGSDS
jgi:hypothetical protein